MPNLNKMFEYPEVLAFAIYMIEALDRNKHKGHWGDCDCLELFDHAKEEMLELQTAMIEGLSVIEVIKEAADVANMVMMIADIYEQGDYTDAPTPDKTLNNRDDQSPTDATHPNS